MAAIPTGPTVAYFCTPGGACVELRVTNVSITCRPPRREANAPESMNTARHILRHWRPLRGPSLSPVSRGGEGGALCTRVYLSFMGWGVGHADADLYLN